MSLARVNTNPRQRILGKIRIDFSPAYQVERDMSTLYAMLIGCGPSGDMASAAFEQEVEAAEQRLTPKQVAWVIHAALKRRTELLEAEGVSMIQQAMRWKHDEDPGFDEQYIVGLDSYRSG